MDKKQNYTLCQHLYIGGSRFLVRNALTLWFFECFCHNNSKITRSTTAQFVVSGKLPRTQKVIYEICQGCPLAPLLFILAAEVIV